MSRRARPMVVTVRPVILRMGATRRRFESVKEAAAFLGVSTTAIHQAARLNGRVQGWSAQKLKPRKRAQ